MPAEKPLLRAVEAFLVEIESGPAIALRDPEGLTDSVLFVPQALVRILEHMDGQHTLEDIARELGRPADAALIAQIREVAQALDAKFMLEGPRVAAERARAAKEYRAARARPAAHAGRAYPAEASVLGAELDSYFAHKDGPGALAPAARRKRLRALIAPHIDYRRGGTSYAWAYRELGEGADVYFVLGTCHAGLSDPFAATLKDYDTPLGAAQTDAESIARLARRSKLDLLSQEQAHRNEHSIELQAVFLKHCAPRERPFKIVPILASYCHELMETGLAPRGDARVARFIEALREELERPGREACLIVGADLAHMGTQFGDPKLTPEQMLACEADDLSLLARAEAVDPDGFFKEVSRDLDRRRICGFSPIHAALLALEGGGAKGKLLRYDQWPDPDGLVSFASLAYR